MFSQEMFIVSNHTLINNGTVLVDDEEKPVL